MIILKYTNFENDNGVTVENVIIPVDIPEGSIYTISPMITNHGVFYRNVTVLEDHHGSRYRVVGNYRDWINRLRPEQNKIGFK